MSQAEIGYSLLSFADLGYAELCYAELSYAELSYAELRHAELGISELSYGEFSGYTIITTAVAGAVASDECWEKDHMRQNNVYLCINE